jgi:hypothetical protein
MQAAYSLFDHENGPICLFSFTTPYMQAVNAMPYSARVLLSSTIGS